LKLGKLGILYLVAGWLKVAYALTGFFHFPLVDYVVDAPVQRPHSHNANGAACRKRTRYGLGAHDINL
jgi:hypothetical protein